MWYKKSLLELATAVAVYTLLFCLAVFLLKPEIELIKDSAYQISVRSAEWLSATSNFSLQFFALIGGILFGILVFSTWSMYNKIRYGKLTRRQSGIGVVSRTSQESSKLRSLQQSAHVQVHLKDGEKIKKIIALDQGAFPDGN